MGLKFVSVEMALQKGDDSEEVVKQFLFKESIPVYLEMNILSAVSAFLEEAVQCERDEEDERCGMSPHSFFLPISFSTISSLLSHYLRYSFSNRVEEE